jgi:hypothetical protein
VAALAARRSRTSAISPCKLARSPPKLRQHRSRPPPTRIPAACRSPSVCAPPPSILKGPPSPCCCSFTAPSPCSSPCRPSQKPPPPRRHRHHARLSHPAAVAALGRFSPRGTLCWATLSHRASLVCCRPRPRRQPRPAACPEPRCIPRPYLAHALQLHTSAPTYLPPRELALAIDPRRQTAHHQDIFSVHQPSALRLIAALPTKHPHHGTAAKWRRARHAKVCQCLTQMFNPDYPSPDLQF